MAEELIKLEGSKEAIYQGLLPQIKGLISGETWQKEKINALVDTRWH
jgi:hypothetical protein